MSLNNISNHCNTHNSQYLYHPKLKYRLPYCVISGLCQKRKQKKHWLLSYFVTWPDRWEVMIIAKWQPPQTTKIDLDANSNANLFSPL